MPNFFFVNRDQTSSHLTRGEASETTAIQHFVQKGRKRARKGKLVPSFKAYPLSVEAVKESRPIRDNGTVIKTIEKYRNDKPDPATCSLQALLSDSEKPTTPLHPSKPSLCHNVSGALDPFQATAITVNSGIRTLINYYTTVYHPTMWPNETLALRRGGYVFEDAVNHVVQASLQDSLAMYCLLTASISRMRNVDRLPCSDATSSNENHYMTQALHLMQERINQAAEHPAANLLYLLTSMIFLSAAEAYRDNVRASRTHLKACVNLLAYHQMKVTDVAEPNLQGQLLMSDLFLSCVNLEACLFSPDDYDPGSVETIDLQPSEADPVPNDLTLISTSLLYDNSISPQVRTLISQIRETYTTKFCLNTTTMTSARAIQTTHWITKRNMAIRSRLLSVFPHFKSEKGQLSTESTNLPTDELLDRALRIVLIQFTLLSMNITGRIKTVKVMSRHLQEFLAPLLLHQSGIADEKTELLLWLVVLGYSCAQDGTENEEWFAERCHELINDCGALDNPSCEGDLDDKDDVLGRLEQIQNRYFYHAQVQRPRLKKLVDGTQARSPEKLNDGILAQRVLPYS